MKKTNYSTIKSYMQECMEDSAHDKEHVMRVLYTALDIAKYEKNVDYDILITACLLHDIGRKEQIEDPRLCHAAVGAEKAYKYLIKNKYDPIFADKVAACIKAHRFRSNNPPCTTEEKILFDADKLDVTGTLGIARTLMYRASVGEPLYSFDENGNISDGTNDTAPSFFQEYKYKLEKLYSRFYTKRGKEIALERQRSAKDFYESMLKEVNSSYRMKNVLKDILE